MGIISDNSWHINAHSGKLASTDSRRLRPVGLVLVPPGTSVSACDDPLERIKPSASRGRIKYGRICKSHERGYEIIAFPPFFLSPFARV